jgi:predicted phage-related endonuclease
MWNIELVAAVEARELPAEYWIQLEQQLYVSGAERVIFVVSDGTGENMVWMEYRAVPGRWEQLEQGWAMFEADLANHVVVEEAPKLVAKETQAAGAGYRGRGRHQVHEHDPVQGLCAGARGQHQH